MPKKIVPYALFFLLFNALAAQAAPANFDLQLTLPVKGGEYRRPYVAVWIENDSGKSVRTLMLWSQHDGQKWLKDLRRWWRKVGRSDKALVDAVTAATRAPGQYRLQFKALDDAGAELPPGEYRLNVEVVREKGGRSMIKRPLQLNGQPHRIEIAEELEIGKSVFQIKY